MPKSSKQYSSSAHISSLSHAPKSSRPAASSHVTITSGAFRGRRLFTPNTSATHPMGSREKLALFNALASAGADFTPSTRVLDLYAGSGALGLEAISRGARSAVFVDNNAKARAAIKENAKNLGVEAKILNNFSAVSGFFDIILVDPPYDNFPTDLALIQDFLNSGGFLALSHPASVDPAEILPDLELLTIKSHAASRISIFSKH